jgi:hypothetical protein
VEGVKSGSREASRLRLESTSEDAWRLQYAIGNSLATQLWAEYRKYTFAPFYMVHEHAQYGRLYFEPWCANPGGASAIAFCTRRQSPYPNEDAAIPELHAVEQLGAFFTHERLQLRSALIPSSSQIDAAIEYGRKMTATILAARAQYTARVDWLFESRHERPALPTHSVNTVKGAADLHRLARDTDVLGTDSAGPQAGVAIPEHDAALLREAPDEDGPSP